MKKGGKIRDLFSSSGLPSIYIVLVWTPNPLLLWESLQKMKDVFDGSMLNTGIMNGRYMETSSVYCVKQLNGLNQTTRPFYQIVWTAIVCISYEVNCRNNLHKSHGINIYGSRSRQGNCEVIWTFYFRRSCFPTVRKE